MGGDYTNDISRVLAVLAAFAGPLRHYYHLHDEEAKRRMESLDFLGGANGRSVGEAENNHEEDAEPPTTETRDDRPAAD